MRAWTNKKVRQLVELRDAGHSVAETALRLDVSPRAVVSKMHRIRLAAGRRHESPWTDRMIIDLHAMWTNGDTTRTIARALNVSRNAVIGKIHRLHLAGRPSPIKRTPPPTLEHYTNVLRRYGVDV
jgi:hypothetical protein